MRNSCRHTYQPLGKQTKLPRIATISSKPLYLAGHVANRPSKIIQVGTRRRCSLKGTLSLV
jgi:hypothetical protein